MLNVAVWLNLPVFVDCLMESAAFKIRADPTGRTPLHWAAARMHHDLLLLFLKHGADPNAPDNKGWTPLHLAAQNWPVADLVLIDLLASGAEIEARDRDGRTALHISAAAANGIALQILINNGADVCATDAKGNTPLQLAEKNIWADACVDIFHLHLAGADTTLPDSAKGSLNDSKANQVDSAMTSAEGNTSY